MGRRSFLKLLFASILTLFLSLFRIRVVSQEEEQTAVFPLAFPIVFVEREGTATSLSSHDAFVPIVRK